MLSNLSLDGNNVRANTMVDTSDRVATMDVATMDTATSSGDKKDASKSGTINYDAQRMIGHGSFGAGIVL
jgi:hypothetical protein